MGDDYGVVSLQAELRLKDRPHAPPLVVAIPLPGGTPKAAHGVNQQDLTAHPWAGLPVIARLVGRDAPGQAGSSADATFILPERPFQNPVARALIAIRKGLSLHPDDRDSAVDALDTPDHASAASRRGLRRLRQPQRAVLPAGAGQVAEGDRPGAAADVGAGAAPGGGPDRANCPRAGDRRGRRRGTR